VYAKLSMNLSALLVVAFSTCEGAVLESIHVQAYQLIQETWSRRMHLMHGSGHLVQHFLYQCLLHKAIRAVCLKQRTNSGPRHDAIFSCVRKTNKQVIIMAFRLSQTQKTSMRSVLSATNASRSFSSPEESRCKTPSHGFQALSTSPCRTD
jgi:hypothetical protein